LLFSSFNFLKEKHYVSTVQITYPIKIYIVFYGTRGALTDYKYILKRDSTNKGYKYKNKIQFHFHGKYAGREN